MASGWMTGGQGAKKFGRTPVKMVGNATVRHRAISPRKAKKMQIEALKGSLRGAKEMYGEREYRFQ